MYRSNKSLWDMILRSPDGEGDGGGGSQSSETSAAATPSVETSVEGGEDFSGLDFGGDDIDDVSGGVVETPPSEQQTTPEAKPAEQPVPEAKPPVPSETKPAAEAPKPTQPSGQQEQQPTPAPAEPTDLWGQFQKDKPSIVENMAKNRYALTKEEIGQLEAEPMTALPALAAKVHVEVVQDVLKSIAGMLPVAFQGMMRDHSMNTAVEQEFAKAWPQIDMSKHGQDVEAFAQLFRQANPKATKAEAIQMVGAMVIAKHGLAAAPPPVIPATPTPAAPQAQPSFRPATPGVATPPPVVTVEEFAGLGMDHDE